MVAEEISARTVAEEIEDGRRLEPRWVFVATFWV